MSATGEAQLAQLEADRRAQAERDHANCARYAEVQAKRVASAYEAREALGAARLGVQAAEDGLEDAVLAHRRHGTGPPNPEAAAWATLEAARRELRAWEIVVADLTGA